jgi:hypothetical protein
MTHADFSSEITALLTRVQSGTTPLGQCLAEGLALARQMRDGALEQFCRKELAGWSQADAQTQAKPGYRAVRTFMSVRPLLLRNAALLSVEDVFRFMEANDEHFKPVEWIVPDPVPQLEALTRTEAEAERRNQIGTMTIPYGHFDPDAAPAEAQRPVYLYLRQDMYRGTLAAIKTEFTRRLLDLLPAV